MFFRWVEKTSNFEVFIRGGSKTYKQLMVFKGVDKQHSKFCCVFFYPPQEKISHLDFVGRKQTSNVASSFLRGVENTTEFQRGGE